MYWGHHAIIDCSKAIPEAIRCNWSIARFSNDLVKKINMVPYGSPQIVYFGSGNKAGYTLVQLIETSNITAHFVEETNDIYLDVFSCKYFNPEEVIDVVKDHFNPTNVKLTFLKRQARQLELK